MNFSAIFGEYISFIPFLVEKVEAGIDALIEESRHNPRLRAVVEQLREAVKEAA